MVDGKGSGKSSGSDKGGDGKKNKAPGKSADDEDIDAVMAAMNLAAHQPSKKELKKQEGRAKAQAAAQEKAAQEAKAQAQRDAEASADRQETESVAGGLSAGDPSGDREGADDWVDDSDNDNSAYRKDVLYKPTRRSERPDRHIEPELYCEDQTTHHTFKSELGTTPYTKKASAQPLDAQTALELREDTELDILRPSQGTTTHRVQTNHFHVDLNTKSNECVLYVYRVIGINNDYTRAKKRTLMQSAIDKCRVLAENEEHFATDYMSKIVAWEDLSGGAKLGEDVAHIPVTDYDRRTFTSTQRQLDLVYEQRIVLQDFEDYTTGRNPTYTDRNEAIAAMNIVFSKQILLPGSNTFEAGKDRFFLRSGWHAVGGDSSKLFFRGYSFKIRPTEGSLLLNFNTAMSMFIKPMTVAAYIEKNRIPEAELDLVGLRAYILFDRSNTLNTVAYIAQRNGQNHNVSVWEHMRQHYALGMVSGEPTAGNANSYCINTKPTSANSKAWFLAKDLWILPYQMYKRKLEGRLTTEMINNACRKPQENVNAIMSEGMPALGFTKKDRPAAVKSAGINVNPKMLTVPARLIAPPSLRFASPLSFSTTAQKTLGVWKTDEHMKLLKTDRSFGGKPAFFLLASSPHKEPGVLRHVQLLWQHAATLGVQGMGVAPASFHAGNSRKLSSSHWDRTYLSQEINGAKQANCGLIVLILPEADKSNLSKYSLFKSIMDQDEGRLSLCLSAAKLASSASARYKGDAAQPDAADSAFAGYGRNVGLKLNVRIGNVNHSLDSVSLSVLPHTSDGKCDTIILGADVIHPGALSAEGTPSITALVGTVDGDYGKYLGSMRRQPYDRNSMSKEIIEDGLMQAMAEERLASWKKENGRYPGNIMYYRDGVGDSQFAKLRTSEIRMIKAAYARLTANTAQAGTEPKITAVVVSKRHNVRLYLDRGVNESATGNCMPGTVVDTGIDSPYFFDFYLISQHGLQGTARPTHYFVVENDIGFGAETLQDFTNALCYTYARSTTSVSYVPPAYYADHLCERGRCYVKEFFDNAQRIANMPLTQRATELDPAWARGGRGGGNPWNAAMDETMFWL